MSYASALPPTRLDVRSIALPDGPPSLRALLGEVGIAAQPLRLLAARRRLAAAPRGDGRTTIDIPGWRSPEIAMAPIRAYLRWLGHDARGWGLGVNTGDPEDDIARMLPVVERAVEASGRRIALVGWSLGGTIAREVARTLPDHVDHVVTYGSPAIGGPAHTIGRVAFPTAVIEHAVALQDRLNREDPLRTPLTAMYTRSDAIVDWRACIDRWALDARHIEVGSSHIGMGLDPDVWRNVADALAA